MATSIVEGVRVGSMIHVPGRGMLVNGKLDADAARRLRASGMRVRPHVWQDPQPSAQDLHEMHAANVMLGVALIRDGATRNERDVAKKMAEVLRPLRKQTHVKG